MILVTGASGALSRLIVERLTARDGAVAGDAVGGDVPRVDVVAGTRGSGQVPAGVPVRRIDFDDPAGLTGGFAGADTLVLVSAGYGEDDVVIARHRAAIEAAEKAGVRHIVYTSLTAAGEHTANALAHRWTERRLKESGTAWTILRNGLYAELLALITTPGPDGRITSPLGDGRLAAVAREDLADVAATVAADPTPHAGRVYELVGEQAVGGADVARALTGDTGAAVSYEPGTLAETRAALAALGVESFQIPMIVSILSCVAAGFMDDVHSDLAALLGKPSRSALEVITSS
ncbi:MAG: NmrA family transcriptional regulator [Sphaerisporangium sp.]|nr:NmrA family transcriptional regulator [Sphaerisporangium sp.]